MNTALTQYVFASNPTITFNDTTDINNYYRLDAFFPDTVVKNIEDVKPLEGIQDYGSELTKGFIKLRVAIVADSETHFNDPVRALKKAFNPELCEANTNSDGGYLPFKWTMVLTSGSFPVQIQVKPVEIPKVIANEKAGAGQYLEIILKAKDPRIVAQTADTITITVGAATGTNNGDMPARPTITLTGPTSASVRITNTTSGEYIELTSALISSDVVVIDNANATILKNGSNAYSQKTSGSSFFAVKSGVVTITPTNLSTGQAVVSFRDSWTL